MELAPSVSVALITLASCIRRDPAAGRLKRWTPAAAESASPHWGLTEEEVDQATDHVLTEIKTNTGR